MRRSLRSPLLLFVLLLGSVAVAQQMPPGKANPKAPTIAALSTLGGQRGTSVPLTINGTNLNEPVGVWTSFATKVSFPTDGDNGKNPTTLRVQLDIPADAPLGFHSLRLMTKFGVSNARLFCVDDLPQVPKAANNRQPKDAQPLNLPCVVMGRADAEATDYFKVSVKENQRLSVEILGRRLGSAFDPQITLLTADGKELPNGGHSNDAPGLQTDARLSYVFKQAGDYLIAVRDVSYRGGPDFHYRLRVGDFPFATTPFPLAVKRGTKAAVSFSGPEVGGVAPIEVQAPTDPSIEAIQLAPRGPNGQHGWPVMLHFSELEEQVEQEPNNDLKQANRLTVPGAVSARLEAKGDIDHFVFTATKGQRWIIEGHTLEHLSPTEVYLVLKNAKGEQVAASNPAQGARIDYTVPADGDYTLAVEHLHSWGGPEEVYRLTFTPFTPDFTLGVNLDRWEAKPGESVAIPLFLQRNGYDGPIEVSVIGAKGLTGTVTLPAGAPKPNLPAATLLMKLDENLPPGPLSFALRGQATIAGKPVSRLVNVRGMVVGALANLPVPPKPMLTQLAVAVLERPPFALAVQFDGATVPADQPVPATVTLTSVSGFAEEVALSVEGNPMRPQLVSVKVQGQVTTFKVLLPPGTKQAVLVGTTKHQGRDWIIRSTPVSTVPPKK